MALSAEEKAAIVAEHATCENDTGSPEVQVALLTVPNWRCVGYLGWSKTYLSSRKPVIYG